MEILKITEKEDGSANLEVELTEKEQRLLLSHAITHILEEFIKNTGT